MSALSDPSLPDPRLKALRFRAWHRGTREADYMVGGFFDASHAGWSAPELAWFEALVEEEDCDILDWLLGTAIVPPRYAGAMMAAMQRLDYVVVAR